MYYVAQYNMMIRIVNNWGTLIGYVQTLSITYDDLNLVGVWWWLIYDGGIWCYMISRPTI